MHDDDPAPTNALRAALRSATAVSGNVVTGRDRRGDPLRVLLLGTPANSWVESVQR